MPDIKFLQELQPGDDSQDPIVRAGWTTIADELFFQGIITTKMKLSMHRAVP